jgi:hypothetical protein
MHTHLHTHLHTHRTYAECSQLRKYFLHALEMNLEQFAVMDTHIHTHTHTYTYTHTHTHAGGTRGLSAGTLVEYTVFRNF